MNEIAHPTLAETHKTAAAVFADATLVYNAATAAYDDATRAYENATKAYRVARDLFMASQAGASEAAIITDNDYETALAAYEKGCIDSGDQPV
jgi:hypothetical protein